MHEERKPQKVIFFLSIEDSYDIYADCRNIYESDFSLEKDAHFIPINISRSVMANMGEICQRLKKKKSINTRKEFLRRVRRITLANNKPKLQELFYQG